MMRFPSRVDDFRAFYSNGFHAMQQHTTPRRPRLAIPDHLQPAFEAIKDAPIVYGRPVSPVNILDVPLEPRETRTHLVVRGTPTSIVPGDFLAAPAIVAPVRIYLAASFHRQGEIRKCRDELLAKLNEPPLYIVDFDKRKVTQVTFESVSAWLAVGLAHFRLDSRG